MGWIEGDVKEREKIMLNLRLNFKVLFIFFYMCGGI